MRVGMTYDLRETYLAEGYTPEETAEFDGPDTIEGIESALRRLGFETERIGHVRALVNALASGRRWDLVFNIAEGLHGAAREAQVPCLLDAYRIPYVFSDPWVLSLCLRKAATKQAVRIAGIPTADWAVVSGERDFDDIALRFPLFVKPEGEGTGKGISPASVALTPAALKEEALRLLARHGQPVLVEALLPGREFTVGIVGTGPRARVLGVMEVLYRDGVEAVYSYETKGRYEERVDYHLATGPEADECADYALEAWRILGCRDGGRLDFRQDAAGTPCFLEANPLAGLNPAHSDLPILCRLLGIPYDQLLGWIMESAVERLA